MSQVNCIIKTKLEGMILKIILEGVIDKNSVPKLEKEIFTQIMQHPRTIPILDAKNLKDISCEGLHLLKRIKNKIGIKLNLENVSNDLFDTLYNTGFTEIFNIKKVLKSINIDNLKCVGEGFSSKVYKLNEEKAIKLYTTNANYELLVQKENDISRIAFIAGVSTPIVYDIVKVGDCYGNIFEYIDGKDLIDLMQEDKDHLYDYVKQFAKAVKQMHKIKIYLDEAYSVKKLTIETLSLLEGEGKLLNKEEFEKIKKIIEIVPDLNTFIHGDCHTENAMYKNGEIIFIDLCAGGYGHPIFDMISMYIEYNIMAKSPEKRKSKKSLKGFSDEEIEKIYNVFLTEYLETNDQKLIEKAKKQIQGVACTRILLAEVGFPGTIPKQELEIFKNIAIKTYDEGLEPLCF